MANTKTKSPKTAVTPLGDRVLVKRMDAEETSKGGIILPDSAKEKPAEGTVIAVGAGKLNEDGERMEMTLKVKDRVSLAAGALDFLQEPDFKTIKAAGHEVGDFFFVPKDLR